MFNYQPLSLRTTSLKGNGFFALKFVAVKFKSENEIKKTAFCVS